MNRLACIAAVMVVGLQAATPADKIVGTWHGTSLCVDKQVDVACHDEDVIYEVDSAAGPRGPVRMQADKIVNGVRENMGVLRLTYDSAQDQWFVDLTGRLRARWTFDAHGDFMIGDLSELPAHRQMRRVNAKRVRH